MVTLKDIAKRCGVTTATVSNIINGKTKASPETTEKVMAVVKELGYRPNVIAQGLRGTRTHTIGVIVEDITLFNAPKIIVSFMGHCEELGYRAIIENMRFYVRQGEGWTDESRLQYRKAVSEAIDKLKSIKVDGIVYVACHSREIDYLPDDPDFPAVMVYAYPTAKCIPRIVLDDEKCSYEMVKYLISKGHERIGIIAGGNDNMHTQKRIVSYQKALFESGLPFNPDMIYHDKWDRKCGYDGAKKLVSKGVTAIYCLNDEMAGGAYDYLREKGIKVPDDVSVVGHDNRDMASFLYPGLTTIDLPLYHMGWAAAGKIISIIEGKSRMDGKLEVCNCRMIERESVKARK